MRRIELEALAISSVRRIEQGLGIEDARIEAKAQWPSDPGKAARRIAGHANAGGGEPVVWLIGLDEKTGVVGVDPGMTKPWWEGLRGWFEGGVSPDLLCDLALEFSNVPMVALAFATDRAPYLVRNAAYGQKEGGAVQWEVPWREATGIRTATRRDLIRLLEPNTRAPEVDVVAAAVRVHRFVSEENGETYLRWDAVIRMYLVPSSSSSISFPRHLARLDCLSSESPGSWNVPISTMGVPFGSLLENDAAPSLAIPSKRIEAGPDDMLVHQPAMVEVRGNRITTDFLPSGSLRLRLQMRAVPGGLDLVRVAELFLNGADSSWTTARWVMAHIGRYPWPELVSGDEEA